MLLSMTGYGRAEGVVQDRQITVELRALNGKGLDLSTRLPALLRPYEQDIRSLTGGLLLRGTIDVQITLGTDTGTRNLSVNMPLATAYYKAMQEIGSTLGIQPGDDAITTILRLPEVVTPAAEVLPADAWETLSELIRKAADALTTHRKTEGASLEADLLRRFSSIESLLDQIAPLEAPRTARVRERLSTALAERRLDGADNNRFEQEIIFYIEKMDFSEEKTRLRQHIDYFRETLAAGNDVARGKLLGFILQEVGREINTLGSKAGDASIQRCVVGMKDELEKCKEQALNAL